MEVSEQLHAPASLPLGKVPQYHWIRDLVGPRSNLDVLEKCDELYAFMKLHWLFFNHTTVATKWAWCEHLQDGCNFATPALMLDLFKHFSRWKLCWLKIFWLLRLKLSSYIMVMSCLPSHMSVCLISRIAEQMCIKFEIGSIHWKALGGFYLGVCCSDLYEVQKLHRKVSSCTESLYVT